MREHRDGDIGVGHALEEFAERASRERAILATSLKPRRNTHSAAPNSIRLTRSQAQLVPVPRRFDRRPPERDHDQDQRAHPRARGPADRRRGQPDRRAEDRRRAASSPQERDLDLVEVAPEARPPVCRVLDYSKYKYEQAQKVKQARKHQQQITVREIKFRPKIAEHDYDTKKHHVERFLRHKDKVKVTIMFRGREVTHPERGTAILDRLAEELSELGVVEQRPMQEGRNMTMMMAPSKAVLAGTRSAGQRRRGARRRRRRERRTRADDRRAEPRRGAEATPASERSRASRTRRRDDERAPAEASRRRRRRATASAERPPRTAEPRPADSSRAIITRSPCPR